MLAPIVSFARPELGSRLAVEHVAGLNERFTQAELIVADTIREICITSGIRGVSLDHDFCLHPRLVGIVIGVQPVVDKNEFPVGFGFVSQAVFRAGIGSLEGDLFPALAV
jgi:hypothetical protein